MPQVTDEYLKDKKHRILDVAEKFIIKQSYKRTNTRDIAQYAQISTTTLYTYFPSKSALISSILHRFSIEITDTYAKAFCTQGSLPQKISRATAAVFTNRAALGFILQNDEALIHAFPREITLIKRTEMAILAEIIEQVLALGIKNPHVWGQCFVEMAKGAGWRSANALISQQEISFCIEATLEALINKKSHAANSLNSY